MNVGLHLILLSLTGWQTRKVHGNEVAFIFHFVPMTLHAWNVHGYEMTFSLHLYLRIVCNSWSPMELAQYAEQLRAAWEGHANEV
jgi:hypothetical protein